jgi:alpha-mannosidase
VRRPRVHLICNAHLDPVWQWRWEEGAAEALATFRTAAALLREHKAFIFNHNEAVLYRWVEQLDPELFGRIRDLTRERRWAVSGGWHLQPDLNLPGLESLVRQIAEGRRYFWKKFGARPQVAYNFDSFGHSGGLPQLLRQAGYRMYIHMRPQPEEQALPADLYRWRGVDGTEILALRIEAGLYHSERDNIEEKIHAGIARALHLGRDVPVFWGLGNHGGGATSGDLEKIDRLRMRERRVDIVHSTPDRLYEALKDDGRRAPLVEGELQRVFTGCYASLARVKRKAEESLGALVQAEAIRTAGWWSAGQAYPEAELSDAWSGHLFNDFHDILPGSCIEPAERDALDQYGMVLDAARRLRLEAAAARNRRLAVRTDAPIPITVLNANPSLTRVPVEVECMADYRPFWRGEWHLRVYGLDGREIPSQEEQPESLLPFNWRKKLCFSADLPAVGFAHFIARPFPGPKERGGGARPDSELKYKFDRDRGLVSFLSDRAKNNFLRGSLFEPQVVRDEGDSWGTGCWSYRKQAGRFRLLPGSVRIIERGPVRTIAESVFSYGRSRIVFHTVSYPCWPVVEFRLRIFWNEERKRLKLAVPATFRRSSLFCEIPGGAVERPADGGEHVFGRWALLEGEVDGRRTALAVIASGQHGLDFSGGELRLSILRSAAYCHERGFAIAEFPARKFMDQGVHEVRLLVTGGESARVRRTVAGLADWLNAPPFALAHLPFGGIDEPEGRGQRARSPTTRAGGRNTAGTLFSCEAANIRMTACKRSWDKRALVIRLHETSGAGTTASLQCHVPRVSIRLVFRPFEIKTVRLEKSGRWREVGLISESRLEEG